MKRILFVVLAGFLWGGVSEAAVVRTAAGTKALLLRFNGLSSLGFTGYNGGLGLRWYVRDRVALRPGIDFSWYGKRVRPDPPPGGQRPEATDDRRIDTSVGLSLALEKHFSGERSVAPYLGALVGATYSNRKTEPSVTPNEPPGTLTKVTAKEFSGGVYGLLGFEWGWTESLTLGGESRFGLTIFTSKSEDEYNTLHDTIVSDTAGFNLGFDTVSLYLSVRL